MGRRAMKVSNQQKVARKESRKGGGRKKGFIKKFFLERGRNRGVGMEANSCTASCSSRFPPKEKTPKCSYHVTESLCNACLCCVSCPLAILCCLIRGPCKIGQCAVKNARARGCCGFQKKRICAAYSSFSDIDSDSLPARPHSCSKNSCGLKDRPVHCCRDNGMKKDRSARGWF